MNTAPPQFSSLFDLSEPPEIETGGVTAIVLCHNEALRLEHFLDFHKAAGVARFLVVDNGSDDGSTEILENDPAVVRFPSRAKYSDHKSAWREVLADHYCAGQWTLFLDVDELFVHPDWPHKSVAEYGRKLEDQGYECLFATMVDMYPMGGLADCRYLPGTPFLDAAPMFDAGNYRMQSHSSGSLTDWPMPPVSVRGGARERLFHTHAIHDGSWFDRTVCRLFFGLDRSLFPSPTRRLSDKVLGMWVNRFNSGIGLPNMSKVAFMRWCKGGKFLGGVHRMNTNLALAPDIGALLHFKYFDDFGDRVHYLAERGQHTDGGAHYKLYEEHATDFARATIAFPGSRRFEGVNSLIEAGLMRDALGSKS